MAIQDHLASSLGRKDQGPNHSLAEKIVAGDQDIQELVTFFKTKPHRDLQKDAIITIAYVSELDPRPVLPFFDLLTENLDSSISRVVYGSMMALSRIASLIPERIFEELPRIIDTMHGDSIVARDYGFRILTEMYAVPKYAEDVFPLAIEEIQLAPDNQLGQYVERLLPLLKEDHRSILRKILEARKEELQNPYHLKRLDKNLKKL